MLPHTHWRAYRGMCTPVHSLCSATMAILDSPQLSVPLLNGMSHKFANVFSLAITLLLLLLLLLLMNA